MKRREREARAEEFIVPDMPFLDGDDLLNVIKEGTNLLQTIDTDVFQAVLAFAYHTGPGLDDDTKDDDDVNVLALLQLTGMLLTCMTAVANELAAHIVQLTEGKA